MLASYMESHLIPTQALGDIFSGDIGLEKLSDSFLFMQLVSSWDRTGP